MTDKKADNKIIIEWQLRCLTNEASRMSPNDLEWAAKMEESYKRKGYLSKREMEVLESIYKKY